MKSFFSSFLNLFWILLIGLSLGGCVSNRLPVADISPWEEVDLATEANPLDLSFVDSDRGFLVGTNRLILETNDAGKTWEDRKLELPEDENFRLISIDFQGEEGWIAGQPGLVMHSTDSGKNWTRLLLGSQLPGDPYLIISEGANKAELATTAGAVYVTGDGGVNWEARVDNAEGGVRDLRRGPNGKYVSVSSLGNFFQILESDQNAWAPHQRASSKRVQSMGFQPNGDLWMLSQGAEIRLNDEKGNVESWQKPIVPITNGYNYLDMAWDPNGSIWAAGGNGTLLVSKDGGESWEVDAVGDSQPTNLLRVIFDSDSENPPKGFVLGERGHLLRWIG